MYMVSEVSPPSRRVSAETSRQMSLADDQNVGRFLFTPSPQLRNALRMLTHEDNPADNVTSLRDELSQRALRLVSPPIKIDDPLEREATFRDIQRNLGSVDKINRHLYLRKIIEYVPGPEYATFQFNVSLPPDFQEVLRSIPNLDKQAFGRGVLEVTYRVHNKDMVTSRESRQRASRRIHDVVWGDDRKDTPPNRRVVPSSHAAYVSGMKLDEGYLANNRVV